MSFQIPAMAVGNGIDTVSREAPAEKNARPAHIGGQTEQKKVDIKELTETLPGNGKAHAEPIKTAADNLQHISLAFDRRLKFEINHESKEILIKVIDAETDKVIKVLPPEELQRLHSRIRDTLGFLFDEKA